MVCKALASLDEPIIDDLSQLEISIHKALASLDSCLQDLRQDSKISIHKALASLDIWRSPIHSRMCDFNPQGSREPRLDIDVLSSEVIEISIHKALASLDEDSGNSSSGEGISIHKALASLDKLLFAI